MHLENKGSPHCVALKIRGNIFTLMDQSETFTLTKKTFFKCLDAAVDTKHTIFFMLVDSPLDAESAENVLLDIQAGGAMRSRSSSKVVRSGVQGGRRRSAARLVRAFAKNQRTMLKQSQPVVMRSCTPALTNVYSVRMQI